MQVNNLVFCACDKAGFLEIHAAIQLIGVEYLSGAVGDLSPCRLNILLCGVGILRHGKVFSAVSYLYLQQAESAQERSRDYKGGKDCRPRNTFENLDIISPKAIQHKSSFFFV